jgi:hypothetical protein
MVAGLLAGGLLLGSGCSSTRSGQMGPAATTHAPSDNPDAANVEPNYTGGSGSEGMRNEGSSTGIYDGYSVPQEDRAGTGGTGYRDAVTDPDASDTSTSKSKPDIRDQDPQEERGTGGSGYEKDSGLFEKNQQFGGSSFPGDKAVPQHL